MKKVLFVCLGNICRSPMAEGLMKAYSEKNQVPLVVDSAGTGSWEVGNPPHAGTQKILNSLGISTKGMRARQVTKADFDKFDFIIAMDQANLSDLRQIAPKKQQEKLYSYLSVVPGKSEMAVPDPWYTGDFQETLELLQAGLPFWLAKFSEE
ncbi:low molecular weight protein-tyrosine-phosphatase [Enterococcus sp. 2201sp1_2201st1_B8_2201SCRN_220225]|uniref:low molecular weight protein-tyrosine-phosphatase n=1 Tax=unclassified Enterococcus TaxID=2608891 RepID=UPI0034A1773D